MRTDDGLATRTTPQTYHDLISVVSPTRIAEMGGTDGMWYGPPHEYTTITNTHHTGRLSVSGSHKRRSYDNRRPTNRIVS